MKKKVRAEFDELYKIVSGIEHDIGELRKLVPTNEEEALAYAEKLDPMKPQPADIRFFNGREIYITQAQAKYLSDGDTWIMGHDRQGWLFVGNGGAPPDDEGNGVWVDTSGQEQHGPTG